MVAAVFAAVADDRVPQAVPVACPRYQSEGSGHFTLVAACPEPLGRAVLRASPCLAAAVPGLSGLCCVEETVFPWRSFRLVCLRLDEIAVLLGEHGLAVPVTFVGAGLLANSRGDGAGQDQTPGLSMSPLLCGGIEAVPLILDVHLR